MAKPNELKTVLLPKELPIDWEGIIIAKIGNACIDFPNSKDVHVRVVPRFGEGKVHGVELVFAIDFREPTPTPDSYRSKSNG